MVSAKDQILPYACVDVYKRNEKNSLIDLKMSQHTLLIEKIGKIKTSVKCALNDGHIEITDTILEKGTKLIFMVPLIQSRLKENDCSIVLQFTYQNENNNRNVCVIEKDVPSLKIFKGNNFVLNIKNQVIFQTVIEVSEKFAKQISINSFRLYTPTNMKILSSQTSPAFKNQPFTFNKERKIIFTYSLEVSQSSHSLLKLMSGTGKDFTFTEIGHSKSAPLMISNKSLSVSQKCSLIFNYSLKSERKFTLNGGDFVRVWPIFIKEVSERYNDLQNCNYIKEFSNVLNLIDTDEINLSNNYLDNKGIEIIVNSLKNKRHVTYLDISNNYFGNEGAKVVSSLLVPESDLKISYLDISNSEIGTEGLEYINNSLKLNTTLIKLNLAKNHFSGIRAAESLSSMICSNQSLTSLNLWNAKISSEGVVNIFNLLHYNISLKELFLGFNNINDMCCESIGNYLKTSSSLSNLNLRYNRIGDLGAKYIAGGLSNKSLVHLNLCDNLIGDEGLYYISKALKTNKSITYLKIFENEFFVEGIEKISKIVEKNYTLKRIDLVEKNSLNKHIPAIPYLNTISNYLQRNKYFYEVKKSPFFLFFIFNYLFLLFLKNYSESDKFFHR